MVSGSTLFVRLMKLANKADGVLGVMIVFRNSEQNSKMGEVSLSSCNVRISALSLFTCEEDSSVSLALRVQRRRKKDDRLTNVQHRCHCNQNALSFFKIKGSE